METSPSIAKISEALRAFQARELKPTKDAKANYGKYATLGNVIDTISIALTEDKLSFAQFPDGDGLTTIIMHQSGEWIKATARLVMDKQTPQGQGSAITYMRRYALSAALGLATEDDDDGNEASKGFTTVPASRVTAPPKAVKSPTANAVSKADADVIKMLMGKLGHKVVTPKLVKEVTWFDMTADNVTGIVKTLEEKIEALPKTQ